MKYILKTNNDLRFDFFEGDMVGVVEGDVDGWHGSHVYKTKAEDLEKFPTPFWIDVGDSPYLIFEIVKVLENRG
jgi:hypothetical protein